MSSQNPSFDKSLPVHVNLSLAVVTVNEHGSMGVSYDGRNFPPATPDSPWSRARFGDLLDAISAHRTRTVRVEVHEFDGSIFTDIVHAVRSARVPAEVEPPDVKRRVRQRPTHHLIEVHGSGFIPGEDITVALAVSKTEGTADGNARGLVDLEHFFDHRSEVMLIGRVSGVVVTERLPS